MTKGQGGGGIRAEHYPKTKQINPEQVRPYDTRLIPAPVPDTDLCDCPRVQLCINSEWASHLDGLLERLLYRDAWAGTDEDKDRAIATIERLLSMFKVRDMCCCGDRKPTNQRVNPITGKIEYSYDGGQTWEEAPNSDDPRFSSPVYAPPEDLPAPGSDRRCIQAGNFVQFCKQQTDAFIADSGSWLALTGLVIAFLALLTVLGAISLGTLTPVILPLMAAIWSLGNSGFSAVMNQAAYDDLLCVLYCHIPEDGIITEAVWQQIKGAIKEEIPGTPGLYFYMYVLSCGPVGVQNMMYIPSPSSPPNCEACPECEPVTCANSVVIQAGVLIETGADYVIIESRPYNPGSGTTEAVVILFENNGCCTVNQPEAVPGFPVSSPSFHSHRCNGTLLSADWVQPECMRDISIFKTGAPTFRIKFTFSAECS